MNYHTKIKYFCLLLGLALGIFVFSFHGYAQSNFSNAKSIPNPCKKQVSFSPYETQYFYFTLPKNFSSKKNTWGITLSNTRYWNLNLYDDCGTPVSLYFSHGQYHSHNHLVSGQRYFLRIENKRSRNASVTVTLSLTQFSTNVPAKRSFKKEHSSGTSSKQTHKKIRSSDSSSKQTHKKMRSSDSSSKQTHKKMRSSDSSSKQAHSSGTSSKNFHKKIFPVTPSPFSSPKAGSNTTPTPQTKQDTFPIKTYFLKIQQGTSLALLERISSIPFDKTIKITASSPEISVSDGIVFVLKEGLYYLTISQGSQHAICTIRVF